MVYGLSVQPVLHCGWVVGDFVCGAKPTLLCSHWPSQHLADVLAAARVPQHIQGQMVH
jgi:hypothetical protein